MKWSGIFILSLIGSADLALAANPAMPVIPSTVFNVTNYGAIGDGTSDNTTSIQNTINAANAAGGGVVEIPAGTFLSGPLTLLSSMNLRVDTNAVLQMLPLGIYPGGTSNAPTFIGCNNVHDLEISGQGRIDGQGAAWWAYNATNNTIVRPMMLNLYTANRLYIHDITYQNPPNHHCGLRDSGGNITISNLTVSTVSSSPNTDGLNFVATNSIIENCHISDGDDNIAMGSTGPLNDLVITNCVFGTGHGVSIGSGISGVSNLTVVNCSFTGTGNGLRIKCARDNSLPIRNLNYLNLTMTNVNLPIVFYSYYDEVGTPDHISTAQVLAASNNLPVNATTPQWRDITISNLTATSSDIGGIVWGPTEMPISNLTLIKVTITAPKTFDLYNVRGVKVVDSQFNFSSGNTFTLCNADLTVSNSAPGGKAVSIGGATSTNAVALYNVNGSMASTDALGANPISLGGAMLTNTGNLTLSNGQVVSFALGTNKSTLVNVGNLNLNATLNCRAADGFTNTTYTLFTYTGTLSGQPVIGATPPGYNCVLDTGTAGQVKVITTLSGTLPVPTTNTLQSSSNPSVYGTAVTFTAHISPPPTNGETIAFNDGSTTLGTGTLNNGQAAYTTSANQLTAGSHSVTAVYGGDGAYLGSTSSALMQMVNPPPGTLFSDSFGASTVGSASPAVPSRTSTSYEVLSGKPWLPAPSVTAGDLRFGIGATSSGVIEVQALFASTPIVLLSPGDFVQLNVTFTNTAGILSQTGNWDFGLYNSGGGTPVAGGLNNTLNSATTTAAAGNAQGWQGYFAQIGYTGATSSFYDRKPQTGSANNNQDVVTTGTSSSCANPSATGIGSASTTPSVALTVGAQYTETLSFTLTASNSLQLSSQLYAGADNSGALLSTMTATTGVPLARAFDGLAFGWRAMGSTPSTMDVSSISIIGQSTPPTVGLSVSGTTLNLSWSPNYLGWLLQSNSGALVPANWQTVPGSGQVTNLAATINPASASVFYRLVSP